MMNWKQFARTKLYIEYIRPIISMLLWYLLMIFVAWETFSLLKRHSIGIEAVNVSLPNIISTIGIISAILITFIFSKLYAEKSEIVERKKRMQLLSAKINSIRKICYLLFKKNHFWDKQEVLAEYQKFIKQASGEEAPFFFSGESGEKLDVLWNLDKLINKIDDDYITYNTFNKTKYTQKDLIRILHTLEALLAIMHDSPQEFLKIEEFTKQDREFILENLNVINEDKPIRILNNKSLQRSFEDYKEIFLEEHYVLLELNSPKARRNFNYLMFDLLIFVVLIITGLIFLNINAKASLTLMVNQLIVSVFVASVIDIFKNIFAAVRFEFKAHGIKEN